MEITTNKPQCKRSKLNRMATQQPHIYVIALCGMQLMHTLKEIDDQAALLAWLDRCLAAEQLSARHLRASIKAREVKQAA